MEFLVKLINKKEKNLLLSLSILLLMNLILFQVLGQGKRRSYFQQLSTLKKGKAELIALEKEINNLKNMWLQWRKVEEDINYLEKYFYGEENGFEKLRQDLNQLFQAAGGQFSSLRYDYARYDKIGIKKVKITFRLTLSYYSLKKFINAVENLPKFLIIENLRFSEIDSSTGRLQVDLGLAAYFRK
ncbi:MAG: hypothetical protein DRJ11_03200 [Candidatus Aminicenantes bacterium]|nr:MAG: hypothetical protein DRJ11_03200 [Candidatus Aminicenantes bacterium]